MFARVIATALAAGVIAGLFLFVAHFVKTTPMIIQAEVYENAGPSDKQSHDHAGKTNSTGKKTIDDKIGQDRLNSNSNNREWAPDVGLERSFFTLVSDLLTSCGFAFLLVGAMVLSGREINWRPGMIWGLCGFAALFAAPALGLAPELPGMRAGDLEARQTWWLGTAAATAVALALIILRPQIWLKAAGLILLLLPHIVGAPHPDFQPGIVPAELAANFAVATLVVSGIFWLLLGGLTGYFYNRFGSMRS